MNAYRGPPATLGSVSLRRTSVELSLRTVRALLHSRPVQAQELIKRLLVETVDPRLRTRIQPILAMITCGNLKAADRWCLRAIDYDRTRRNLRLRVQQPPAIAPTGRAFVTGP